MASLLERLGLTRRDLPRAYQLSKRLDAFEAARRSLLEGGDVSISLEGRGAMVDVLIYSPHDSYETAISRDLLAPVILRALNVEIDEMQRELGREGGVELLDRAAEGPAGEPKRAPARNSQRGL